MTGTQRPRQARGAILARAMRGTYVETQVLVETIVSESVGKPSWRPARAGAAHALAEAEPRIWMTAEEFAFWITSQSLIARRLKEEVKPLEAVGIAPGRKLRLLRGQAPVEKVEALACAHYAMRFPMPIQPGDSDSFSAWAQDRFGAFTQVAIWLQLRPDYVNDRVRGFDVKAGERVQRLPDAQLIRAMDWVYRVGPACPYGERADVEVFPGQV